MGFFEYFNGQNDRKLGNRYRLVNFTAAVHLLAILQVECFFSREF